MVQLKPSLRNAIRGPGVGKFADLAVLSQDTFTAPFSLLPRTESVLTIVGGDIVYESGRLAEQ